MKILLFEDRGTVAKYFREALEDAGHEVLHAISVYDVRSHWEDHEIDCLIIDLNVDPQGLTEEEAGRTNGGVLTGWVWLDAYVYKENPAMKSRTVIYTEYKDKLESHVDEADREGITVISKRGSDKPMAELLERVARIAAEVAEKHS